MRPTFDNEYGKQLYWELLVLKARRGDDRAFEEIVREFEEPMFYYVRRLVETEEDAWDIVQQIWIKAFRGIGSLRETTRFRVWLYRIAHCTAMGHHRAAYRNQAVVDEAFDADAPLEADSAPNPDEAERVHVALDRLDPDFREVLTLRFLEDLSVNETAEVLGVPAGTVKSRLFHAKKELRKVLRKEDRI